MGCRRKNKSGSGSRRIRKESGTRKEEEKKKDESEK